MSKESKDTKSEASEEVKATSTGPEEVNVEVVEDVESAEKTSEDVPGSVDTEEEQGPVTLEGNEFKNLEEKAGKASLQQIKADKERKQQEGRVHEVAQGEADNNKGAGDGDNQAVDIHGSFLQSLVR